MSDDLDPAYLSGARLYGDHFTQPEIDTWYEDEREGYAGLGSAAQESTGDGRYGYHTFNIHHAFRHLPHGMLGDALGLGAAYGDEFLPVAPRLRSITILEPSLQLRAGNVGGVPTTYCDPTPSGKMSFDDGSFDLVTSFGVLHHIPNVTTVVHEVARVMRPGGYFVLREPIHSMGDWRRPRAGLTRHERGIPVSILDSMVNQQFTVASRSWCDFPLWSRWGGLESRASVLLDHVLATGFSWNARYHATRTWQKVRPRSIAMVLVKD